LADATTIEDLIRALLDADEEYYTPQKAEEIVNACDQEPEAFAAWLWQNRRFTVYEYIHAIIRGRNRAARREAKRARLREYLDEAERTGEVPSPWFELLIVDEKGLRKPAHRATGREHAYVAQSYRASAAADLRLAEFHRAVARKCKDRPVEEVMTQEKYDELFRSIVGEEA
jgi:hypothetical protein